MLYTQVLTHTEVHGISLEQFSFNSQNCNKVQKKV